MDSNLSSNPEPAIGASVESPLRGTGHDRGQRTATGDCPSVSAEVDLSSPSHDPVSGLDGDTPIQRSDSPRGRRRDRVACRDQTGEEAEADGEGKLDGPLPTLIPPGEYTAQFLHHDTQEVFGEGKLFMHFRIIDMGEHFGKEIYRAYRVRSIRGKPGRGGRFTVGLRSELFLMLLRLVPGGWRRDRISLAPLKHRHLKVRVRTVTTDYLQRPLPDEIQYSVVDDILAILDH